MIIDHATYHRHNEIKQLCSNNHIDVGMFGSVKMQCNAEFKKHAADVVESHRKLTMKYEAFVKAWKHLSKQSIVDSWYKAGLR